jgi:pimeloyl-ACP methyl ester carboxylesterase
MPKTASELKVGLIPSKRTGGNLGSIIEPNATMHSHFFEEIAMRLFILLLTLLVTGPFAQAVDLVREQRWADEILPAILDGEPVWLEQASGHKFLGLFIEAAKARGAVILVHGMGVHPDWGINNVLRTRLAEQGYSTLSIQMPVQAADAVPGDYVATFPEASERIGNAAEWLKARGYTKMALISHSLGGRMARTYFVANQATPVKVWAALSMGFDDFKGVSVPVLDIYAEQDHPPVLNMVAAHQRTLLHPASVQRMLPATGHFYEGKETEVTNLVKDWLDKTL